MLCDWLQYGNYTERVVKLCLPRAVMLLLVVFSLVWLILLGCFYK